MIYRIYSDGNLVYDPDLAPEGYDAFNIRLTQELNKAGSLEFSLTPKSEMYSSINLLRSTITMYSGTPSSDGDMIFRGRVIQQERDFYNNRSFYCEGELAFLNDRVIAPYELTGSPSEVWTHFNEHSSSASADRTFTWGSCDVTDPNNTIVRSNISFSNMWSEINEKFVSKFDAYLFVDDDGNNGRRLNFLEDPFGTSSQIIEFGRNLLDLDQFIDGTSLFTVLYPLGARDEQTGSRLTIASVNDGKRFVENTSLTAIYGRIATFKEYDDITVASNLLTKANGELQRIQNMSVNLTLKALDLHILDVNEEELKIGYQNRVVSIPHNLDTLFRCSKIVVYPESPDKNEYTFGTVRTTLTGN